MYRYNPLHSKISYRIHLIKKLMSYTFYGIIGCYLSYILFLKNNVASCAHGVSTCDGRCNDDKDVVSSTYGTIEILKGMLYKQVTDLNNFTLIDFGCGYGNVITHMSAIFQNLIGIELDAKVYEKARINTKKYDNVTIMNMNMCDYDFKDTDTLLFMYEPLWNVKNVQAMKIYNKVFDNLNKVFETSQKRIYIGYVTGTMRQDLSEEFIKSKGYKIISVNSFGSLILKRNIYVLTK